MARWHQGRDRPADDIRVDEGIAACAEQIDIPLLVPLINLGSPVPSNSRFAVQSQGILVRHQARPSKATTCLYFVIITDAVNDIARCTILANCVKTQLPVWLAQYRCALEPCGESLLCPAGRTRIKVAAC
jgi:hypothetical protein